MARQLLGRHSMEADPRTDEPRDEVRKRVVYEQVASTGSGTHWPMLVVALILAIALIAFIFVQIR